MKELNQRRYEFKQKLRQRKPVFGAWTSLGHPSITEIFSRIGVDFVGVDIEHSTISQEQTQRIITAAQVNGTLCFPRVATHNQEMIKRLLDSGADGLMIPMVSLPEEAEKLISWCKYPPEGSRSFGVARAQGYGFDFDEYVSTWNDSSSLIMQIETVEGVENIDQILDFEQIDGVMIGPYDISGSLGIPGQLDHPKVNQAAMRVVDSCRKHNKACGTHIVDPDIKVIEDKFKLGYTFVVLASDIFLLWKWSERMRNITNQIKKKEQTAI